MSADPLARLARLYGVQTDYLDATKQLRKVAPESLLRILRSLGAPIERREDAADAVRCWHQRSWRQGIEPVIVAWDGQSPSVVLRLAESTLSGHSSLCTLEFEQGGTHEWWVDLARLPLVESSRVEGVYFTARRLQLPMPLLPLGYHRLRVEAGPHVWQSLLIAAPRQAHQPDRQRLATWGLFAPLYALRRADGWGSGDFTDLEWLLREVRQCGGGVVATLPLLAAYLDEPFEPSPYAPASRLFWNEFYLDIGRALELNHSAAAQSMMESQSVRKELSELQSASLVDYRRGMALKRKVLELLSREFFAGPPSQFDQFQQYLAQHPTLVPYAEFRAAGERFGSSWPSWPAAARDGRLQAGDFDPHARDYHLYVQWLCDTRLERLSREARREGLGLYLDLPVGVNSDSFDVWRYRQQFVTDVSVGSPPDPAFPRGQDWGFPPLHPMAIRQDGYVHVREYLRHQMQMAGVLRIDHVMGLSRLFVVPRGMEASGGAYVQYRSAEMFAVFCLESHRNQTLLVGEDLGTVPEEIPQAMHRHALRRMYVLQYEGRPDVEPPRPPQGCAAALNTHDMPTLAAFWQQLDIDESLEAGILTESQAAAARKERQQVCRQLAATFAVPYDHGQLVSLREACLEFLCRSEAAIVIVGIEDLWGETKPQNLPGTTGDWPNWRRKLRFTTETALKRPEVLWLLKQIARWRETAVGSSHSSDKMATLSGSSST